MIENERQLAVTRTQLSRMEQALKNNLEKQPKNVHPRLYRAMLDGLESIIQELQQEIADYEKLKKAPFKFKGHLEELPSALIKARIARDLTQEELANLLHMKAQQIQRYEKTQYAGISFNRIIEIAKTLRLKVEAKIHSSKKHG